MVPLRTSKNFTPKTSIVHGPILINGNGELDAFCAGNGTDGLSWGTAHVIENLEIDAKPPSITNGIELHVIDRYLIIRNCTIIIGGTGVGGSGIRLYTCDNIRIDNCTIEGFEGVSNLYSGMGFDGSNNIAVVNCTIEYCGQWSLSLRWCQRVNMSYNKIHDNSLDGIYQVDSDWSIINNNTLTNNRYGINLNPDSDNNHVFYNCIENNELGNIKDDGSNNNIHDNDVCAADEGVPPPAIPSYPLIFVIAFGSIVVAPIAYRILKSRRRIL